MSEPILKAAGLQKSYQMGPESLRVLRGASATVQRGEWLAIMGASGSGKSTLLHILGALDLPDEGTVQFNGQDVFSQGVRAQERMRNRSVGFVFQFYHLLPELNMLENVLLPAMVRYSVLGWLGRRSGIVGHARDLLGRMGLKERLRHRPSELSGGERQRVAIARALVNKPQVLLADEPTGNLDAQTGTGILALLKNLNDEGQTIVMVTHDPKVASAAHRVISLADGKVKPIEG